MGLIYPAADIFNAWHRIVHGRPSVRAAALEFLGNLLSANHRETLLPLLEASSWDDVAARCPVASTAGHPSPSFQKTVIDLVQEADAWLAACSVTLIGELDLVEALESVRAVSNHPDRWVRQAAEPVIDRLSRRK
jgi:hypothetical protein